jgi:transcriptional regulator with XRE-family HTH domain
MESEDLSPAVALGRAIAVRRTALGMKRKDLAGAARLSYPYISEIENGAKEPSAKALRQIADALELSATELASLGERLDEGTIPPERPTRPLPDMAVTMAVPDAGTDPGPPPSDPSISPLVRQIVREELEIWERTRLPALIRAELAALERLADR